jgi:hypothetical protein
MTGLLQNLAHIGRGEPIPGAARVALPPRFAAPARSDHTPRLETWPGDGQPSAPPHAAIPVATTADDPIAESQASPRMQVGSDDEEPPLRFAAKVVTAAQPIRSNGAPSRSAADAVLPEAPRDSARVNHQREAAERHAPFRDEATAPTSAAPLGQAVLAGQAQRRRETPPVIKVTIDRIDIRSPEPPRAARAVKPAPKSSVSLSDYLRRPGPGGRA